MSDFSDDYRPETFDGETGAIAGTDESEQPLVGALTDAESCPMFGKYGRIDNLARAITHGEFAIVKDLKQMYSQDYGTILRSIETLVADAIRETREACAQIADRQAGKNKTIGDTKAIARTIRALNAQPTAR
jgi:hypothetical protein